MKAIINGIRYDTENAVEVGSASFSNPCDFQYWEATLYKTPRSGKFFLAGSGGPMSRYAKSYGRLVLRGGSKIDPLSHQGALEWAKRYLDEAKIKLLKSMSK